MDWVCSEEECRAQYTYIFTQGQESVFPVTIGTIFWLFKRFNLSLYTESNREWSLLKLNMLLELEPPEL